MLSNFLIKEHEPKKKFKNKTLKLIILININNKINIFFIFKNFLY